MQGNELILDDNDTSITADTDDQTNDIKVGGTDKVTIDSTALKTDDIQENICTRSRKIDGVLVKDGGLETSTTGKIKQKGLFIKFNTSSTFFRILTWLYQAGL